MPHTFVIFDDTLSPSALTAVLRSRGSAVDLFALTSNWSMVRAAERASAGCAVTLVDAADLVDREVSCLRETIPAWSSALGRLTVNGRTLRDWFLLPDEGVSTWWFSVVAEKNTLKVDGFFQMAQLRAAERCLTGGAYERCVVALGNPPLRRAVLAMAERHGVATASAGGRDDTRGLRTRIEGTRAGRAATALAALLRVECRAIAARRAASPSSIPAAPAICVTYFPAVDREAASHGVFRNTMLGPLQDVLAERYPGFVSVAMAVPYDGHDYGSALLFVARFSRQGTPICLLEAFTSVRGLARAAWRWARDSRRAWRLLRDVDDSALLGGIAPPESAPIVRHMLDQSFGGWTGLSGLIFLEQFKAVFRRWPSAAICLYFMEMHAWEKALNAAKKRAAPATRTVGFQHTHVAPNLLNYTVPVTDVAPAGPSACPMPDVLVGNGEVGVDRLARCGLPTVHLAEAVRQLPLCDRPAGVDLLTKEDVVLLTGTIVRAETRSLVSFVHEAIGRTGRRVWLKGHPSQPMEDILDELGLQGWPGAEVRREPTRELLARARVLVTGNSSVSLEGVAFGCEVVAPLFSDSMFISPLLGFESCYHRVTTPEQLALWLDDGPVDSTHTASATSPDIVGRFWCLDPSLRRWRELLA